MIYMHSKYDNMHKNIMFYALIYINNHVITSKSCMLLKGRVKLFMKNERNLKTSLGSALTDNMLHLHHKT